MWRRIPYGNDGRKQMKNRKRYENWSFTFLNVSEDIAIASFLEF